MIIEFYLSARIDTGNRRPDEKSLALYFVVFIPFLLALDSANAASRRGHRRFRRDPGSQQGRQAQIKLGEGTLGGTKRMALYEQLMNKMFGSNVKIGFTPGRRCRRWAVRSPPNLPPVNRRQAMLHRRRKLPRASGQAEIFSKSNGRTDAWPDHRTNGRRRRPELRVFSGLPGTPYNKIRVPKTDTPKRSKIS